MSSRVPDIQQVETLNTVARTDVTEKFTFRQKFKEGERISHVDNWERVLQAERTANVNSRNRTAKSRLQLQQRAREREREVRMS